MHPQDRRLLDVMWGGQRYVNAALPFGLRSASKVFNAVADALLWIMGQHGVKEGLLCTSHHPAGLLRASFTFWDGETRMEFLGIWIPIHQITSNLGFSIPFHLYIHEHDLE